MTPTLLAAADIPGDRRHGLPRLRRLSVWPRPADGTVTCVIEFMAPPARGRSRRPAPRSCLRPRAGAGRVWGLRIGGLGRLPGHRRSVPLMSALDDPPPRSGGLWRHTARLLGRPSTRNLSAPARHERPLLPPAIPRAWFGDRTNVRLCTNSRGKFGRSVSPLLSA